MKREEKELIQRIIQLGEMFGKGNIDPFQINVIRYLNLLREIFPKMKTTQELKMDIEALRQLINIVFQQKEFLKQKSSKLYLDPLLVEWKIENLSNKELSEILINSWHPIVEINQLNKERIKQSIEYWREILGGKRKTELEKLCEATHGKIKLEDLKKHGFLSEETFIQTLNSFFKEVTSKIIEKGQISYWEAVKSEKFHQTVKKAYLLSFLLTAGLLEIEIDPIREEITLKIPMKRKGVRMGGYSLPIPLTPGKV